MFYQAMRAIAETRYDDAYTLLEQNMDSARSAAWLGFIAYEYFKDDTKAEQFFKLAIEKDPSFAETYLFYASLLQKHGRYAEMNANINKAAAISGVAKDQVNHLTGMLNESQGKLNEAIECYKNAILSSFDNSLISFYEKAIERCEIKKKYL